MSLGKGVSDKGSTAVTAEAVAHVFPLGLANSQHSVRPVQGSSTPAGPVARWVTRLTPDQKILGSTPGWARWHFKLPVTNANKYSVVESSKNLLVSRTFMVVVKFRLLCLKHSVWSKELITDDKTEVTLINVVCHEPWSYGHRRNIKFSSVTNELKSIFHFFSAPHFPSLATNIRHFRDFHTKESHWLKTLIPRHGSSTVFTAIIYSWTVTTPLPTFCLLLGDAETLSEALDENTDFYP